METSAQDGLRETGPGNNSLEKILKILFPGREWLHNKQMKDENNQSVPVIGQKSFRPDFRCDELKMIVEFDGDSKTRSNHYSIAKTVILDRLKDQKCKELGYRVIRIPVYIQLDKEMIQYYFDIIHEDLLYSTSGEHGFMHEDITLPADFCEIGVERFKAEMAEFPQSVRLKII